MLKQKPVSLSGRKDIRKRLRKNKKAMCSVYILAALFLFAFAGPFFCANDYTVQLRGMENIAPSFKFLFGTDNLGRDLLVRTMIGTRISLSVGIIASFIALVIGSVYGAVSGYLGGRTDDLDDATGRSDLFCA